MNCPVCDSKFENNSGFCSQSCKSIQEMTYSCIDLISGVRPTDDPRIFFYPLSFGRIIDEWSILCLKRANTNSIKSQQELDYLIFKVRRSIETQLGQIVFEQKHRNSVISLTQELASINSKIWRERDLAEDPRISMDFRKSAAFKALQLARERDNRIKALDFLVSGRSHLIKIFNGKDSLP